MTMPKSTLVYNLGRHIVEVTDEGMLLITPVSATMTSLIQGVQLDETEGYRLCTVLQAWFRHEGDEHEGERGCK